MKNKRLYLTAIKKDWKHSSISVKLNIHLLKDERLIKAEQVYTILKELWDEESINLQEQFMALYLNRNNKLIGYRLISTER